ncbi:MAG: PilT/PilU family type 4a pilus ATPase, partial [Calditrichota bacterium]
MDAALFDQLLTAAVKAGISDIHMKVGSPIIVRDSGHLVPVTEAALSGEDLERIIMRLLVQSAARRGSSLDMNQLENLTDYDTSFSLQGVGRFRVNIYRQRGTLSVSMRVIPSDIPQIEGLQLPEVLGEIALEPRGLVLLTGTTGSGKSTTLAAMLDHINHTVSRKIITIEDPIEFLLGDEKCFITQREVHADTESFAMALRAALRQDPDVIMIGEMRDRETIDIALKAAETGHLVFSTVHTTDAEGTISRLIGAFDLSEQAAVRLRMTDSLRAVISQRLVSRQEGDRRVAAVEVMRMTQLIKERVLSADTRGLRELIEKGAHPYRMQTFDQHLTQLVKQGI